MKQVLRSLVKNPSFTLVAVSLLALGIGVNTAVFTVMNRVLLERLPVRDPQALIELGNWDRTNGRFSNELSYPAFQNFSNARAPLSGLCGFSDPIEATVLARRSSGFANAVFETANYARVVGIEAALGRLLNDADGTPSGETPAAVLGFDYWQSRFAGDTRIIGEAITVNNVAFVIVGVMPQGFHGLGLGVREDLVLPVHTVDAVRRVPTLKNAGSWWMHVVGRLQPGASIAQAREALSPGFASAVDALAAAWPPALAANMKKYTAGLRFEIRPAALGTDSTVRQQLEMPLRILMIITGVLFVIACANLAGLILARAASRSREIGIRLAIGCGRVRLMREMLMESLVRAGVGGLAGVAAAWWAGPALAALLAGDRASTTFNGHPNAPAMLVGLGLALVAGILPGLIPALLAARLDPQDSIRKGGVPIASPRSQMGRWLIVVQMATSLALVTGAGQFIETLRNYRNLDVGYRADNLILVRVNPGSVGYSNEQKITFTRRMRDGLSAIPGVKSATFSTSAMGQMSWTTAVRVPGYKVTSPMGDATGRNIAGARFVETNGLTLLAGRDFDARDTRDAPPTMIVNQSFARHFFGSEDVIGRQVFFIDSMKRAHTIVGVVKDARDRNVKTAPRPTAYTSYEHDPLDNITFAIRTTSDSRWLMASVTAAFRSVDLSVPLAAMRTMRVQMDEALQRERMMATLSAMFGAIAILVAAVGLYGLMAWATAARTREIGVRMALGARPVQVEWLALKDALWIAAFGVLAGVPLYLVFGRAIRAQVFGVGAGDPRILAGALGVLLAATGAAAFVPARRAGRVDPMDALRHE